MRDMITQEEEEVEILNNFCSSLTCVPTTLPEFQKAKAGIGRMKNHLL